jgi:GNAT superfamily N-acetyltransferase
VEIRKLGPGDARILAMLSAEESDFDVAGEAIATTPLSEEAAATYLGDPGVLHWVAQEDGTIVGFLLCYVERRRTGNPRQVLLYEVGVREASRRQGVGRALIEELRRWMLEEGVREAWVAADNPEAEEFYAACGFERDPEQPVQMTLRVED